VAHSLRSFAPCNGPRIGDDLQIDFARVDAV